MPESAEITATLALHYFSDLKACMATKVIQRGGLRLLAYENWRVTL